MQCHSCSKTFATELSVCPSCGAMPSQHAHVESSLRLADKPYLTERTETALHTTNPLDFVSAIDFAEESAASEILPPATLTKREFTSTLIEFPKRTKAPEWRDAVRERVQAVRNRKQFEAGHDEARTTTKIAAEPVAAPSPTPAMVIDLKPNIEHPADRLVARALERVERSRQTHQATAFAAEFDAPEEIAAKTKFDSSFDRRENLKEVSAPAAFAPQQTVKPRKILPPIDDTNFNKPLYDLPCDKPTEKKKIAEAESDKNTNGKTETIAETPSHKGKSVISLSLTAPQTIETIVENDFDSQVVAPRVKTSVTIAAAEDYAPLFRRLAGGTVDFVLCAVITLLLIIPFISVNALTPLNAFVAVGIFAAVKFVYLTFGLTLTETTLGLKLMRLRVVYADDATAPSLIESAINSFIYLLTLATGGLLLTAIFFSSEKRALHDLISGTVVVRET